jgi:hypothetical protein
MIGSWISYVLSKPITPLINTVLNNPLLRRLMAPTATDRLGFGKMMGVAKKVASERFGPGAKARNDILGSFVRHSLTEAETASEALLSLYTTLL